MNCVAEFVGNDSKSRCPDNQQKTVTVSCQRLTSDLYAGILNNYYMKPSHKKPYYYIIHHNENDDNKVLDNSRSVIPTNYAMDSEICTGSYQPSYSDDESPYRETMFLKEKYDRTSNQSTIKMEIHSGKSD